MENANVQGNEPQRNPSLNQESGSEIDRRFNTGSGDKEIDLDRSGVNTDDADTQNFGSEEEDVSSDESQPYQNSQGASRLTSQGQQQPQRNADQQDYSRNTPDIDEETYKMDNDRDRQSRTGQNNYGSNQNSNRGGQQPGQFNQDQDNSRQV